MKLAETGRVWWIVVDQLDRFGTKGAHQLVHYLYRLQEAGCKLYDAAGKEWTGADIATTITAVVEGEKSKGEQTSKSHRILGGKAAKAKAGEWQGGPVRLGLDVVCYARETGEERWRVVFEARNKRRKVYPDCRSERFDGPGNFPRYQEATEVLRVAPSNDPAKVAAAVRVFRRFATESVSMTALAHELNRQGFRNSYGGMFQGHHIGGMLADPVYTGTYTWNKVHLGKFHRWRGGQAVPELNYEEQLSKNDKADWVQSRPLFPPLVDQQTWDAVQRKLDRPKHGKAPRTAALYLAGLVYCGNCGARMVAGPARKAAPGGEERLEYYCGSYHKAVREGRRRECKCLRNGVFQDVLEGYVERYLEETGQRLQLMTGGAGAPAPQVSRLEQQEAGAWQAYQEGFDRLTAYLAEHHPEDYVQLLQEEALRDQRDADTLASSTGEVAPPGTLAKRYGQRLEDAVAKHRDDPPRYYWPGPREGEFLADALAVYRANFDPAKLRAEVERLEAEHTALYRRYADLPTPRAKEKAKAELAALEARIAELEQQQEDVGEAVAAALVELRELAQAIHAAQKAMASEAGERAFRQRAEALRAVIRRIDCTFTATGKTGGGPGRSNARLVKVTVEPVVGDAVEFRGPDVIRRFSVSA
jgi:hypothetical protein